MCVNIVTYIFVEIVLSSDFSLYIIFITCVSFRIYIFSRMKTSEDIFSVSFRVSFTINTLIKMRNLITYSKFRTLNPY